MKNLILQRISNLQGNILYLILFSLVALLFFITLIYHNTSADPGNKITVIIGGIVAFVINFGILYRLNREISLRKNAGDELAANELKYKSVIENAGVVMYTTSLQGLITFASSRAAQLTGYTPEELTGRSFTELLDGEGVEHVKQRYKEQLINNIHETFHEFCIRTRSGDLKWVEQSAVLIYENDLPTGFQCVIKDISERKEMEGIVKKYEAALVQNQEHLQSILDNATSMIWIKDLEGRYLLINKEFKKLLHVNTDIIGKTDFHFGDQGQAKRFKDTDDRVIATGKPAEIDVVLEMPDGNRNILITKFPLLDAQNRVYGLSGIATDITDRMKYQEGLIQARKQAEDAKKQQEQFLATMSHEIRTPMNGIQGMTDLLLETALNDEQKDFAQTIKHSSDNLLVIINDILDFSKIKAGKLTIEKIDFNLKEVTDNIKGIFKHSCIEKKLTFQVHVADNIPSILNGDPYRLNQILVNLVGNAIKFTHTGGVDIHISIGKKTAEKIILNFAVSDTGIGIHPGKLSMIFESFTQAGNEISRKYGGTGLGLAITKQLTELQKGKITVESKINSGTVFKVSISYNYSTSNTASFFTGQDLKDYQTLFNDKKFLVAEDNEVNQKVIRHVLQKAGGKVDIANNGLEAINLLKEENKYNLIIMDLQMPEMDGYAATKYIRNVMKLTTPIIAMTATTLKGDKAKCLEMGMNDYLTKPFDFAFIYKKISLLLGEIPVDDSLPVAQTPDPGKPYDLSLLEEMDDNEYISDILGIFLKSTPAHLIQLHTACNAENFEDAYKTAHKLKSSTGLLMANDLLAVLIKIEETAIAETKGVLPQFAEQANNEFKIIEYPLQQHLNNIQTGLRIAV